MKTSAQLRYEQGPCLILTLELQSYLHTEKQIIIQLA